MLSPERSAHVEHDSSSKVQKLRHEIKLALEHGQVSTMCAMRSMMTEFTRNNSRSDPVGAKGSVAKGEITAEVGETAVGEGPRGAPATDVVRDTAAGVEAGITRSESGSAEGSAMVGRGEPTRGRTHC